MGERVRDCWQCDICGSCWLKEKTEPYRCASQKCRSSLWNRTRKSHRGRPDKGMVRVKQRTCLTLDLEGNHHALCSCLLCLTEIGRHRETVIGRPKGVAGGGTGRRKGTWKVKVAPREGYESRQIHEALIRG